jgi:hypothetical protein
MTKSNELKISKAKQKNNKLLTSVERCTQSSFEYTYCMAPPTILFYPENLPPGLLPPLPWNCPPDVFSEPPGPSAEPRLDSLAHHPAVAGLSPTALPPATLLPTAEWHLPLSAFWQPLDASSLPLSPSVITFPQPPFFSTPSFSSISALLPLSTCIWPLSWPSSLRVLVGGQGCEVNFFRGGIHDGG